MTYRCKTFACESCNNSTEKMDKIINKWLADGERKVIAMSRSHSNRSTDFIRMMHFVTIIYEHLRGSRPK